MRFKLERFGTDAEGVTIKGDRQHPEPSSFIVRLPFGTVEISRCSDDSYWVHTIANREGVAFFNPGEDTEGALVDARLHATGQHSADMNLGDFTNPELYDAAIRITRKTVPA